jgi:hypothetical protein
VFIQIIQGRCSRQEALRATADQWREELAPTAVGWLGGTYGFTDDDQFVGVVRFESREAAEANARRPEQTEWWSRMERLFDGPVEFHDCDQVVLMMDGGSDDAGFVQVIRGKIDNPDALERDMPKMQSMLHDLRPEILGATFAVEPDGTFTETVAFTDEAAARAGESKEVPNTDEMRQAFSSWDHMVHDLSYLDLHHPWFASRT